MLPAEIRLKIYGQVFANNKMLFSRPRENGRGGVIYYFEAMSEDQTIGPFELLLTCHAAYREGLAEYWAATTVMATIITTRSPYTYLAGRLPDVAKAHVKHLRQIADPDNTWGHVPVPVSIVNNPDIQLHEFLLLFPRLEKCEFRIRCINNGNFRERILSFDDQLATQLRRFNSRRDCAAQNQDSDQAGPSGRGGCYAQPPAVEVIKTFYMMSVERDANGAQSCRPRKVVGLSCPTAQTSPTGPLNHL